MLARRNKPLIITLIVVVAIAATGGTAFIYNRSRSSGPFPENVLHQAKFSLYYPQNMPDGLSVNPKSISGNRQVVAYIIESQGKNKYYVSVQTLPSDFDFSGFKNKFFDTDEFDTNIGSAFVGDIGSGLIGSIRTKDNSWILISTGDYSTPAYKQLESLERTFLKAN